MSNVLPYKIMFYDDRPALSVSTEAGLKILMAWSKGGIINIGDNFVHSGKISDIYFCTDTEQFAIDELVRPMMQEQKSTAEILEAREKYKAEYRKRYLFSMPNSALPLDA